MARYAGENRRRMVAVALLAGVLLIALVIATGGSVPFGGSSTSPPPPAPVIPAPGAAATATPLPPRAGVKGTLSLSVQHLSGSIRRFRYTIHSLGKVPIAGFQINSGA